MSETKGANAREDDSSKKKGPAAKKIWPSLQDLCENNGITTRKFVSKVQQIQKLETFQLPTFALSDITAFPMLKELFIIHQSNVESLAPLSKCANLTKLWVTECSVSSLRGISKCTNLQELVLSSNRISTIKEISGLESIVKLWLNDNCITSLEHLSGLVNLSSLWVARNQITWIGNQLDTLQKLEELNMSCNFIGKFRELLNLARLSSLKELYFSDPHFGSNPVCKLCNYQTYVMYHLGHLKLLDGRAVEADAVKLAEATYMKKKMYYNMRIKTVRRNLTNVLKRASSSSRFAEQHLKATLKRLEELVREIECTRMDQNRKKDNLVVNPTDDDDPVKESVLEWSTVHPDTKASGMEFQLIKKQVAIQNYIDKLRNELELCQSEYSVLKQHVCQTAEDSVQRLITELETGGNVRFEEEKPSHSTFQQCELLVQAAFDKPKFAQVGIVGVKVVRVIKVHNKHVQNSFQLALSEYNSKSPSSRSEPEFKIVNADQWFTNAQTIKPQPLIDSPESSASSRWDSQANVNNASKALQLACAKKGTSLGSSDRSASSSSSKEQPGTKPGSGKPADPQVHVSHLLYLPTPAPPPKFDKALVPSEHAPKAIAYGSECSRAVNFVATRGFYAEQPSAPQLHGGPAQKQVVKLHNSLDPDTWRGEYNSEYLAHTHSSQSGPEGLSKPVEDSAGGSGLSGVVEGLKCSTFLVAKTCVGSTNGCGKQKEFMERVGTEVRKVGHENVPAPPDAILQADRLEFRVTDQRLVVPEFIVQVEYVFASEDEGDKEEVAEKPALPGAAPQQQLEYELERMIYGIISEEAKERERYDMLPFLRPLVRYLRQRHRSAHCVHARRLAKGRDKRIVQLKMMEPVLPSRPSYIAITDEMLLKASGSAHPEMIQYLNLHGCKLPRLFGLHVCKNLRTLLLPFNEFTEIDEVSQLTRLRILDAGFNVITKLPSFAKLMELHHLRLDNNLIESMEGLFPMRNTVPPNLISLDVRNNPLCQKRTYLRNTLIFVPSLQVLDGDPVTLSSRADVCNKTCVSEVMILQHAVSTPQVPSSAVSQSERDSSSKCIQFRSLTTPQEESNSQRLSPRWASWEMDSAEHPKGEADCSSDEMDVFAEREEVISKLESVEELSLNHLGLERMENFEHLANLRKLVMRDNEIARIEGLEKCTLLEELCLEENRIYRITGLAGLKHLRKLDLGKNMLSTIEWSQVRDMKQLTQLSLEDNKIENLAPLSVLENLLELYICNNKVAVTKEVQHLRSLPKLIILDLSGNPISNTKNYRLYTIYHLRQIKVLDGAGIDRQEQMRAREQFSGKLTVDFLHEKIGHEYFEHIRELDLSSCRIRDIERLSGEEFINIRDINLSNNLMTSLGGLYKLPLLETLRLDNNRIESLYLPNEVDDHEMLQDSGTLECRAKAQTLGQGIYAFPNLVSLYLGGNSITDIRNLRLSMIPKLRLLHLHNNDLSAVGGLMHSNELRELHLGRNKIRSLDSLEEQMRFLPKLAVLHLEENGIRTLCDFSALPALTSLFISSNRISDMNEIVKLERVSRLRELAMFGNPVARRPLYRQSLINALQGVSCIDAKVITEEERGRVISIFAEATNPAGAVILSAANTRALTGARLWPNPGFDAAASQNRVPIRMTSVNLESLSQVSGRPGPITSAPVRKTGSLPSFVGSRGMGAQVARANSTGSNNSGGVSARGRARVLDFRSNNPPSPKQTETTFPTVKRSGETAGRGEKKLSLARRRGTKFTTGPVLMPKKPSSGAPIQNTIQTMLRPSAQIAVENGGRFRSWNKQTGQADAGSGHKGKAPRYSAVGRSGSHRLTPR